MQLSQELRLLLLIAAAFAVGVIVLILEPDYRFARNLESNREYYPAAESMSGQAAASSEVTPAATPDGTPSEGSSDETGPDRVDTDSIRLEPINPVEF